MTQPGNGRLFKSGITLLAIWLGIVIYSCLSAVSGLLTLHEYSFRPWAQIHGNTLYIWMFWVPLTPLVLYLAERFPIRPTQWASGFLRHFLLMTLVALLHAYFAALLYYHIGWFSGGMENYEPWQHTGHFLFADNMYLVDAFIYACVAASQNIKLGYLLAQQRELDSTRVQAQLNEAKLLALKMQVNPHFLFNTLNSISVLVRKREHERAGEMISHLSDFFRRTLEQGEEQLITLRQEMELIRDYLSLEKVRFGERLEVEYRLDEDCLQQKVPALLLQPLAENAVKYGLSNAGRCHVKFSALRVPEGMELIVEDSGSGTALAENSGTGIGLANVRARLQTLYNGLQRFEFSSRPGRGTLIRILIPQWQVDDGIQGR